MYLMYDETTHDYHFIHINSFFSLGYLLCSSGSVQRICSAPRMPVWGSAFLPQTGGLTGQFRGRTGVSLLM